MGYADRLYALQEEYKSQCAVQRAVTSQRFAQIHAEQARQAQVRAAWEAGAVSRSAHDSRPEQSRRDASPRTSPEWDDEDSFWEFRSNRVRFE